MFVFLNYLLESFIKFSMVGCLSAKYINVLVESNYVYNILKFLKLNTLCQFKQLLDIVGVDYPVRKCRFELVYVLVSICFVKRILIKVPVTESLLSVVNLFASAGWLEREVWDMFGVFFVNHCDLRRILTDYGFIGFPLRKDFPLSGYIEVRYNDILKKIVAEPIESTQEYRLFDFVSPWEWSTKI